MSINSVSFNILVTCDLIENTQGNDIVCFEFSSGSAMMLVYNKLHCSLLVYSKLQCVVCCEWFFSGICTGKTGLLFPDDGIPDFGPSCCLSVHELGDSIGHCGADAMDEAYEVWLF